MPGLWNDLQYARRQLVKLPSVTVVAVITLALGIGASTAIFSAVSPILFEPLPYPHPDRILAIWNVYHDARSEVAFGTYYELLQRAHSFEALSVFEPWQPAMTGPTQPERLPGQSVSATYFHVLGVAPATGRDFVASEDVFNGPKVVILSFRFSQQHFGGPATAIGRQLKLDGDNYTVVGVMPGGFENVLAPEAELWTPLQYDTRQIATSLNSWVWGNHLHMIGRLRPGITRSAADHELLTIARTPWSEFPRAQWASMRNGFVVDSLQQDVAHTVRLALLAVMAAVMLLLAIACVNVVNLQLARSVQRRGEFATRAALGASKRRIVRQLVTESLLLALLGGAGGVGVAVVGVRALIVLSPPELPRLSSIAVDKAVFAFAFAVTALVGAIAGLVPALHLYREELLAGLQQVSRRTVGGHAWTRRILVVAEVALALVLLVSTGLLLRSMQRLLRVDPGFTPSHVLTLQVQSWGHQFDESGEGDRARWRFFQQALEQVRHVPGVERAAFTSLLPLSDDPPVVGLYGAHFENDDPLGGHTVFRYAISSDYCQTMQIPLRRGRFLDEHDTAESAPVALVSESLAKRQFHGEDPLGKRLHVGPTDRPWFVIVGVVGDIKQHSLALDEPEAVYIPAEQSWFADPAVSFVVRTRESATGVAPEVKQAIWSVDKNQPIVRVTTMENLLAITEAERRFVLILFELFGAVALVLAAVGIYGVMSGTVTERMREIGVRAALGASRSDLLALFLREGMRMTAFGVAIGLAIAVAASHLLVSLLFGVSHLDLLTYGGGIALLAIVAGLACWTPAWRAAHVDPSITLRAE